MAQYKLIAGIAQMPDPDAATEPGKKRPSKTFRAGDVIESDVDLVALHGREKFQLMSGTPGEKAKPTVAFPGGQVLQGVQGTTPDIVTAAPVAAAEVPTDFEAMTDAELRQLAADEEIDLQGAVSRDGMLWAVRNHYASKE